MGSKSFFGDDEADSDLDDQGLPYPKPLDRSAFLEPDFDPATFLSSLESRLQTLDDLQAELRDLAQSLNRELVDLVNDNYQDFLSLGSTLAGGEEKLGEIRVGLSGFTRDVKLLKDQVTQKTEEVATALEDKRALQKQISMCYALLETADRLDALETWLNIARPVRVPKDGEADSRLKTDEWEEQWQDTPIDGEDDVDESTGTSTRLKHYVDQYLALQVLNSRFSRHPFVVAQQTRVARIHDVLQQNLEDAARQQTELRLKQKIIRLRAQLDE